jgi:hypothetical protein
MALAVVVARSFCRQRLLDQQQRDDTTNVTALKVGWA